MGSGQQASLVAAVAAEQVGSGLHHPFGPRLAVYKVAGRMFALLAASEDPPWVNLKCDPGDGVVLRAQHRAVAPGWHMDKRHWITVTLDGSLDDDLVASLVEDSWELVVAGLPRRARAALGDPAT